MKNQYKKQVDEEVEDEEDSDLNFSIKDYLKEIFQDERLEIANVKNQERGDTEILKKDEVIDKLDRQNKMGTVAKMLKELSWEERFEWIHQQKIKGNRFFSKEQYGEAIEIYLQGLMGIEFKNTDPVKQKRMEQENILPLLTNVATALIRLKKYENASAVCDKVLSIDPNSIKGNCKKGEALMYCRFYDKAVVYLKNALQLAQKDADKVNIWKIYQKLQTMKKKEQNVYKQMFPPSEAAKNEQEMNQLIKQSKSQGLNDDEQNFLNNANGERDDDDDEEGDSDENSCDEDEYGYEYKKYRNKKGKISQEKMKILEYNDQIEMLKQYIGPLSILMIYPIKLYKTIATAIGCKRRQNAITFESDTEDQKDDQDSNEEDNDEQESD